MKTIFKKILRVVLWSLVALLLGFILYMAGAVMAMQSIEDKCKTLGMFSTTDDQAYMCMPIKLNKPKKGVDS